MLRNSWVQGVAVALIILIGAVLRINGLGGVSLDYDEMQSAAFSSGGMLATLAAVSELDPHPPVYYLQLRLWRMFGSSDVWLRMNSVFWSLLGVIVLWRAARVMFGHTGTALAAAALLAVNPMSVFYAAQARMYAMQMTLTIAAALAMHQALVLPKGRKQMLNAVASAILALLIAWSHGVGAVIFFALFIQVLVYILSGTVDFRRLLVIAQLHAACALLALPWYLRSRDVSVHHTKAPELFDLLHTIGIMFSGYQPDIPRLFLWTLFTVAVLVTLVVFRRPGLAAPSITAGFIVAPVLLYIVASHEIRPVWLPRILSWQTPFACLLLALFLFPPLQCPSTKKTALFRALGVGALCLLCFGQAAFAQKQKTFREDYRYAEAIAYVQQHSAENDVIVPSRRLIWAWHRYEVGVNQPVPAREGFYKREGGPTTVNWIAADNIKTGTTYWLIIRERARSADLTTFGELQKAGNLDVQEERRFGLLTVIKATRK